MKLLLVFNYLLIIIILKNPTGDWGHVIPGIVAWKISHLFPWTLAMKLWIPPSFILLISAVAFKGLFLTWTTSAKLGESELSSEKRLNGQNWKNGKEWELASCDKVADVA